MHIQTIIIYLIVFIAAAYLAMKFFYPKALRFIGGKKNNNACGDDNCKCG